MAAEPLFPADFWSPPKIVPGAQGDSDARLIYLAVGNAASIWEAVEESLLYLLKIFSSPCSANSIAIITRMFGMIESSSTRKMILEETAKIYYGPFWARKEIRSPFLELMKNVRQASWRRNELVHGRVLHFSQHGQTSSEVFGSFLVAPEYMIGRQKGWNDDFDQSDPISWNRSLYRYKSSDINQLSNRFNDLHNAIHLYALGCGRNENRLQKNVAVMLQNDAALIETKASRAQSRVPKASNTPDP